MSGDLPSGGEAFDQLLDLQRGEEMRRTDKAVTVAGRWHGHDVIAKQLTSSERYWVNRFAHEVAVYEAFGAAAPPWRVPQLYYAGRTVLVIERLPGAPPHTDRYPPPLPETTVSGMIAALAAFAAWQPPPGPLRTQVTDWAARIRRYVAAGDLPAEDEQALLAATADAVVFGHGDPLASNVLSTDHRPLTFIDFEFTGLGPGGADLALLGLWLGRHDPGTEQRCADTAEDAGHLHGYRAMRVLWIAREQRLYESFFDTVDDRDHRQWLKEQAAVAITALRRVAGRA